MDKIIDRVYKYLDFKGIPPTRIEKEVGLSNGYLNTQLKRNADIGESVLVKILDNCLDINTNWLLLGKGDMLLGDNIENVNTIPNSNIKNNILSIPNTIPNAIPNAKNTPKPIKENNIEGEYPIYSVDDAVIGHGQRVELYDAIAYGGDRTMGREHDEQSQVMGVLYIGWQFKGATGAMFIRDNSMYPTYPSHSILVYKKIHDIRMIVPGSDYIIETEDYRLAKRLLKGKTSDIILATSINKEVWEEGEYKGHLIYAPFELPVTQIQALYLILGRL